MTVEVYAVINGRRLGNPKVITVKINEPAQVVVDRTQSWGEIDKLDQDDRNDINNLVAIGEKNGTRITSLDFADLYNSNARVQLHYGSENDTDTAFTRLELLGNCIINALVTAGLKRDTLETALNNTVKAYKNKGVYSYFHSDGSSDADRMRARMNSDFDESSHLSHTIASMRDNTGNSRYLLAVSFKDFVDDIIAEYNKLI